jgi:transposase
MRLAMTTNIDGREQRGLIIAATKKLTNSGHKWYVPSDTGTGKYMVVMPLDDDSEPVCSCPDHETRGCKCKHIHAVEYTIKREENPDGSVTETRSLTLTEKRTTYPQNWTAYNKAQTNEKAIFQTLLRDLCEQLPDRPKTNGRQWLPMRDAIFAAVFKVYCGMSARRYMTDLREAHDKGYISKLPCHNTVLNVFEADDVFPILRAMVERSATPLKSLETKFACDSSGFSGCRYDRWIEHKYGSPMKKVLRAWVKAHIMIGVQTNVVTAVEIHDQHANDGVQLPALLGTTAQRFKVDEVSADLAYSSHRNLDEIDGIGAAPLIPFKCNASAVSGGLWAKMFHYFNLQREEFLRRYHLRSNVESTFSMVKRKFGDSVRSKTDVAMKNETLCKFIAHNICCTIQEMHECGIDPTCWAETPVAQQATAG